MKAKKQKQNNVNPTEKDVEVKPRTKGVQLLPTPVDRATKLKIFTGATVVMVTIIILERIFRLRLTLWSVELARNIQADQSDSLQDALTKIASDLCDKYGMAIIFFVAYQLGEKQKSFYLFFVMNIALYLNLVLKLMYHSPRPYFEYHFITPKQCPPEYGNPSGHSQVPFTFFLTFYNLFIEENKWLSTRVKRFLFTGIVMFLVSVGFSRVYLGVHTVNQVAYGWSWGIYTYIILCYCLKDTIRHHIHKIDQGLESFSATHLKVIVFGTLAYCAGFGMCLYSKLYYPNPALWDLAINKCKSNPQIRHQDYIFTRMIMSFAIIAGYIGYCIHASFVRQNPEVLQYKSKRHKLFSMVFNLSVTAVISAPILFVPKDVGVLGASLFKHFVPFFFTCLYLFGFADRVIMSILKTKTHKA